MVRFLAEASQVLSKPDKDSLEHLLLTIEILARNNKLDIGLEWVEIMNRVNSTGLGATRPLAPGASPIKDHTPIDFDVTLLETSAKCKSGFAGVYTVSGTGFRALVPDPKSAGSRYLGTWPTALEAAIDRYRWFDDHGLPYGNIASYVEDYRKKNPMWSTERCLLVSYQFAESTTISAMKWPFTVDQIVRTIERFREVNGIPNTPLPKHGDSTEPRTVSRPRIAPRLVPLNPAGFKPNPEPHGTLFGDDDPVDDPDDGLS